MRRWFLLRMAVAGTLLFTSCGSVTKHGDVKLYRAARIGFLPQAVDQLAFPKIPLGKTASFRYRVESLPQIIYPGDFILKIPRAEITGNRRDQPWRACVVRASLMTVDGKTFFERTIRFSDERPGGREIVDTGGNEIPIPFADCDLEGRTKLPRHLSYDFLVEVMHPSARQSDRLEIQAFTVLPDKKR
jgi:hypothetical protein